MYVGFSEKRTGREWEVRRVTFRQEEILNIFIAALWNHLDEATAPGIYCCLSHRFTDSSAAVAWFITKRHNMLTRQLSIN